MAREPHAALLAAAVLASCEGAPLPSQLDRRVEVRVDASSVDGAVDVDAGDAAAEQCLGSVGAPTAAKPCGCQADCDSGETCLSEKETGWPGGFCTRLCDGDEECTQGLSCALSNPDSPDTGACQEQCTVTSDCRPGHVCRRGSDDLWAPGPLICMLMCQDDADCPATGSCDRYTTMCGDILDHPGDGEIGDPCASNADCRSGWCLIGAQFPGGYCTALCSYSRQGCPLEASCIRQGPDDQDAGACFRSCGRRSECREDEGYACAFDPKMPDYPVCFHP